MVQYNTAQLRQIQQYRAVCEGVLSSRSDTVIHPLVASQPQAVLDEIVDHYNPDTSLDLLSSSTSVDTTPKSTAKQIIKNIDTTHEQIVRSKLARINQQETTTPFEKVTKTESAHGFSEESLINENLTSEAGVGIALQGLMGAIEEMGGDPSDMLPDSILNMPIASSSGDPLGGLAEDGINTLSEDRTISPDEALTGSDLVEKHADKTENLRHHLKYVQDCFYLEHLHDRFMGFFDHPNCPKLVWKQAALDIQNQESPLDVNASDQQNETDSQPTNRTATINKLFDQSNLPPHLQDDTESDTTESAKQSGLSQFG